MIDLELELIPHSDEVSRLCTVGRGLGANI